MLLVGTLVFLNDQAEAQIKSERHAQNLYQDVDTLAEHTMKAAYDGIEFREAELMVEHGTMFSKIVAPKVNVYRQSYQASLTRCDEMMNEVERLVAQTRDQREIQSSQKLHDAYANSKALILRATVSDDPFEKTFPAKHFLRDDHPFKVMRAAADQMLRDETEILRKRQSALANTRKNIKAVLGASVLFVIFMAAALTFFLSRGITNRLRLVMDNTVRIAKRQPLHPVINGSDEIAELDRVLHRTADQLAELEKFKSQMTAMVTHELRTPLTSIYGILTLMRAGALGELPTQAADKAKVAESNAKRLLNLINDLLEIEKIEAGKLDMTTVPTSLESIFSQAVESVRDFAAAKNITLAADSTDLEVLADEARIVQVLINLISNGVKYSEPGTQVAIKAHIREHTCEVLVQDHGRGIPAEFQEKIFEPFEQVTTIDKRDRNSTGLGLAICKKIIAQHGGTIHVISEVGVGSTFVVTLPLAVPVTANIPC